MIRLKRWKVIFNQIKDDVPILLIEHNMDVVFSIADRISVLVNGKIIASGTSSEIKSNLDVRKLTQAHCFMNKSLILKLDNIYSSYSNVQVLNGVNLLIRKGEIVSLLGRNGMGKTTTIKSICGILKPHSGKIEFNSVKINGMESYKIARLGIGLVARG